MTAVAIGVPVATVWAGPDAPRPEDAAAVADVPDVATWAEGLSGRDRRGLHGRTLTQALLGEPVEIVTERGEWAEVVLPEQPSSADPRGYPGWVRRAHLAPSSDASGEQLVVTAAASTVSTADGAFRLSFGTRLPRLESDGDRVRVALPGPRTATLPVADVRLAQSPADTDRLLMSARQFLGLRYLWGGTSAWGLDCSGLVHLVHRAHGVRVPRDAFDQHAAAAPVPLDEAAVGDLYFFARLGEKVYHVGFVTTGPQASRAMLHAPESGELVEDAPLAGSRMSTLVAAGHFAGFT